MRLPGALGLILVLIALATPIAPVLGQEAVSDPARSKPRAAFEDARFGLELNWGVHALLGKGDRVMERDRLPVAEYEKLPARFNPAAFDAIAWVRAAKGAGARYLAITAKDHDGFCFFDSKLTGYDVVDATPFGKDVLKLIADACKAERVPLFVTYSLLDWHHPDYVPLGKTGRAAGREASGDWSRYVAYYQGQVRELCSNYGAIAGIRFEGMWDKPDASWDLEGTYKLIRELQPGAMIANNHGGPPRAGEDVQSFDRVLPAASKVAPESSLAWECLETMNQSRGYNARDTKFKSAGAIVGLLARSAGSGANLLLGIAPLPDGNLPKEALDRLGEVGRWLEKNGASIYGTRPGPVPPQPWGVSTRSLQRAAGSFYLHILDPGIPVSLPDVLLDFAPRRPGSTDTLVVKPHDGTLVLELPEADRDPFDTVVVLSPKVLGRESKRR